MWAGYKQPPIVLNVFKNKEIEQVAIKETYRAIQPELVQQYMGEGYSPEKARRLANVTAKATSVSMVENFKEKAGSSKIPSLPMIAAGLSIVLALKNM